MYRILGSRCGLMRDLLAPVLSIALHGFLPFLTRMYAVTAVDNHSGRLCGMGMNCVLRANCVSAGSSCWYYLFLDMCRVVYNSSHCGSDSSHLFWNVIGMV